ncbi:hypothetical protein YTPLAS18_04920 [Nitrospira sp.]|nr:hypothetical protein YTPLAS18_04920 [Nitrospira sp.]
MNAESRLTLAYLKAYPLEAVKQLESWPAQEVVAVLSDYAEDEIAAILEHAPAHVAADVLLLLPRDRTVTILASLPSPAAIGVLRQCDRQLQRELLSQLDTIVGPGLRSNILHAEGSAASLADPRMLTLAPDVSVASALEWIKRNPQRATYYHYVVERDGALVGMVTTKQLLIAEPTQLVATIMTDQIETVPADAAGEELRQHPQWRRYPMLPVVDRNGLLVGVLRHQALQRLRDEGIVPAAGNVLSDTLIKVWETYALVGLRIMTDLVQVVETSMTEAPRDPRQEGRPDDPTPATS